MADIGNITVVVHADTTELEEKLKKVRELSRPWWCPLWLFRLLSGGR